MAKMFVNNGKAVSACQLKSRYFTSDEIQKINIISKIRVFWVGLAHFLLLLYLLFNSAHRPLAHLY